jgi:hypothetical protein
VCVVAMMTWDHGKSRSRGNKLRCLPVLLTWKDERFSKNGRGASFDESADGIKGFLMLSGVRTLQFRRSPLLAGSTDVSMAGQKDV